MIADPTRSREQMWIRLREPFAIARVEIVVPHRRGVAAHIVPRRPASDRRAVPFAVFHLNMKGVFDAIFGGRQVSRNLERARLEIFSASPVLHVARGAIEHPKI